MDMMSVLQMAGTKWNIGSYHPSFGTGGYCIPLAPQYVLEGATHPEKLTLLHESMKTDFNLPQVVAESVIQRGAQKVAVLGLAYTGDLKVDVLSPAKGICKYLKEKGVDVKVHDPYYSSEEVQKLVQCERISFPEGLEDRDCILIVSPHRVYKFTKKREVEKFLGNTKLVLDNMGIWRDIKLPAHIEYFEAGTAYWLSHNHHENRLSTD